MVMGKIFDLGIFVLNRIKFKGEEKKLGEIMG